ncbi:selenoprotein B glycine/betaine/sarcosine/D-proline reductase [Desulfopila inferna]|nr:selenoprotein B glycine/betaine/sarcosine/D-proline reductase [Desulfopila inferna]
MARLNTIPEPLRSFLAKLPCPTFETRPWAPGTPLARRRVAIISTAGLHRRDDRPFEGMSGDFRVIADSCIAKDLVMSHISTNFDRTGFQQDWNVAFPLDRLHELAAHKSIGSVADFHYSFMGATDPADMETAANKLAGLLRGDQVDAALLVPV